MSQLNAFAEHVLQDPELQNRLKAIESEDDLVERILAEAATLGYNLDAEAVLQHLAAMKSNEELTEAELGTISGGVELPPTWNKEVNTCGGNQYC